MKGSLETCMEFLNDLGFEEWFRVVKKNCRLFEIPQPNFKVVCEYIEGLGWTGELEAKGLNMQEVAENLKKFLSTLKIQKDKFTFKSLGKLYAEKLGYFEVE
jgi:adenylate cyclase class IV